MTGHTAKTEPIAKPQLTARLSLVGVLLVGMLGVWLATFGMRDQTLSRMGDLGVHPEAPILFVLRIVLFVLAVWIAGGTLLAIGLRLLGWHRSAINVSRVLPAPVRSMLFRAAGIGIVGSLMIQSGAMAASKPDPSTPSSTVAPQKERVPMSGNGAQQWPALQRREAIPNATAPVLRVTGSQTQKTSVPVAGKVSVPANTVAPSTTTAPATTTPSTTTPATTTSTTVPVEESAPSPVAQKAVGESTVKRQHSVAPGEHFWSIATTELLRNNNQAGGQISDQEIAQYWEQLIDLNRSQLPDPANPDLLRIGMVLELPN